MRYLLIFLVLLFFSPVAAEDNYLFIGGGLGLQNIDNHDLDHENKTHHESRDAFDSSYFGRIGYGREFKSWLTFELYYEYAPFVMDSTPKNDAGTKGEYEIDIHNFNAAAKVFLFPENRLRPFASLGIGPMYVAHELAGPNENNLGLSWIAEGGLDFKIDRTWSMQTLAGFRDGVLATDSYEYGVIGAFVKYHF